LTMVKDLYLTRRLDVDIGTLVNVALAETFIKRYHLEVNDDPHSTVSPWTPDNRRVITFHAPLKAPDMVKKVVGVDVLPVSEKQFIRYDQATRVVTVETEPLINIAGGERFKTNAVMVLQPAGSGSEIVISANLAVAIWGVQGAIEAVMCAEAKGSFERWVDLLHEVCIECLDRACTPEAPLPIRHLMLEVAVDLGAGTRRLPRPCLSWLSAPRPSPRIRHHNDGETDSRHCATHQRRRPPPFLRKDRARATRRIAKAAYPPTHTHTAMGLEPHPQRRVGPL